MMYRVRIFENNHPTTFKYLKTPSAVFRWVAMANGNAKYWYMYRGIADDQWNDSFVLADQKNDQGEWEPLDFTALGEVEGFWNRVYQP